MADLRVITYIFFCNSSKKKNVQKSTELERVETEEAIKRSGSLREKTCDCSGRWSGSLTHVRPCQGGEGENIFNI